MSKIKYLVMDVDGTMTDGKIYMGSEGELFKQFDIKDGYGIRNILPEIAIVPVVLTGRKSKIVERRCKELDIEYVFQDITDKYMCLEEFLIDHGKTLHEVAYIGDDLNDLDVISKIKEQGGTTACPNNAIETVKKTVDYVCKSVGGDGAIREFIDYIANQNQSIEIR